MSKTSPMQASVMLALHTALHNHNADDAHWTSPLLVLCTLGCIIFLDGPPDCHSLTAMQNDRNHGLLQSDLPAQVASQAQDPYHPKKRRKTQSSQQHASRSAKAQVTISPPLTDQWLQCRDAIVRLVKALSPRQQVDADASDAQLFKTAPEQLQALLNMLVAAKESNGTGLVCAFAAVVGQWAQYALREPASSAAVSQITDMSIGMLADRVHLPVHCQGCHAATAYSQQPFWSYDPKLQC
jgi:hypothetical protein